MSYRPLLARSDMPNVNQRIVLISPMPSMSPKQPGSKNHVWATSALRYTPRPFFEGGGLESVIADAEH